jgi:hypothetical protein
MRVYHFLSQRYGIEDIKKRRLKIATIADVNDPFELVPFTADRQTRHRFRTWRKSFDRQYGMLCFSGTWRNPVQWSHYGDRHKGLCLGFEVQDDLLTKVEYRASPATVSVDILEAGGLASLEEMHRVLSTKYDHWRYEDERRVFTRLNDRDPETGLYFAEFCDGMSLKEVIVGAMCELTRKELTAILGESGQLVESYKARLAFRTYTVTRQKNAALWR